MGRRIVAEREEIAARRIERVLRNQTIANGRTLEQKISDAGPGQMRVDPHVLTNARKRLQEENTVIQRIENGIPWYHLATANEAVLADRLALLLPIHEKIQSGAFSKRLGQCLEIATYRALLTQSTLTTLGGYTDLGSHDDSVLYTKEEPPSLINGRSCGTKKLDFIVSASDGIYAGIEIKNAREWMYPNRSEIKDFLYKTTKLDLLPVFIARRIPFVTFKLLNACGVIVHQTYNQLYPANDTALAAKASDKTLLGYHDIRIGNEPDARLLKFIQENLPRLMTTMRPRYDEYKDLLTIYADGMPYHEFAARVRRRNNGTNEDYDWPEWDDH